MQGHFLGEAKSVDGAQVRDGVKLGREAEGVNGARGEGESQETRSCRVLIFTDETKFARALGRTVSSFSRVLNCDVETRALTVIAGGSDGRQAQNGNRELKVVILGEETEEAVNALKRILQSEGDVTFYTPACVRSASTQPQTESSYTLDEDNTVRASRWLMEVVDHLKPMAMTLDSSFKSRDEKGWHKVRVVENTLQTAAEYPRACHLMAFDISNTDITYSLSDHVRILPHNDEATVQRAASLLGTSDLLAEMGHTDGCRIALNLPRVRGSNGEDKKSNARLTQERRVADSIQSVPLDYLLREYLDLNGKATRAFLLKLSLCIEDPEKAAAVRQIATDFTLQSKYAKKVTGRYSMLDVIELYRECISPFNNRNCDHQGDEQRNDNAGGVGEEAKADRLRRSVSLLMTLVPKIEPRSYSAASSPMFRPGKVEINFVVLRYPTESGEFKGLSTTYLSTRKMGDEVLLRIDPNPSRMDFASDVEGGHKIACVALGSGISPIRGICTELLCRMRERANRSLQASFEERSARAAPSAHGISAAHDNSSTAETASTSELCLYYGVRHEKQDYIFREELEDYVKLGIVTNYQVAFSNDQKEFITPATRIRQHPEPLVRCLVDNFDRARFMFCGPAGPAYDSVETAIREVIEQCRPGVNGAEQIQKLKEAKRWDKQAYLPLPDPENPFSYS